MKNQNKNNTSAVSLHALYRGMEMAVALVDKYGDAYWPAFERLEAEINERESRVERLTRFRRHEENSLKAQL